MQPGSPQSGTREYLQASGRRWVRRCRRLIPVAGLVTALALRALTPAGYMPGSLADGNPFVLCPGSTPGARWFIDAGKPGAAHHHHHGANGSDDAAETPWEFCPFGAAFAATAPAYDPIPAGTFDTTFVPAPPPAVLLTSTASRAFLARGPPLIAA